MQSTEQPEMTSKLADLRSRTHRGSNELIDLLAEKDDLDRRIAELEEILDDYEELPANVPTDEVHIGNTVHVSFEGYEDEFAIVSHIEADPLNKKISASSPVGKALLGHKVGDTVSVDIGVVKRVYRVLEIK